MLRERRIKNTDCITDLYQTRKSKLIYNDRSVVAWRQGQMEEQITKRAQTLVHDENVYNLNYDDGLTGLRVC